MRLLWSQFELHLQKLLWKLFSWIPLGFDSRPTKSKSDNYYLHFTHEERKAEVEQLGWGLPRNTQTGRLPSECMGFPHRSTLPPTTNTDRRTGTWGNKSSGRTEDTKAHDKITFVKPEQTVLKQNQSQITGPDPGWHANRDQENKHVKPADSSFLDWNWVRLPAHHDTGLLGWADLKTSGFLGLRCPECTDGGGGSNALLLLPLLLVVFFTGWTPTDAAVIYPTVEEFDHS